MAGLCWYQAGLLFLGTLPWTFPKQSETLRGLWGVEAVLGTQPSGLVGGRGKAWVYHLWAPQSGASSQVLELLEVKQ